MSAPAIPVASIPVAPSAPFPAVPTAPASAVPTILVSATPAAPIPSSSRKFPLPFIIFFFFVNLLFPDHGFSFCLAIFILFYFIFI